MQQFKNQTEEIFKLIEKAVKIQQKRVLTLNEASEYTGLSKSYIYYLTSKSLIPHSKPTGKVIYFDRSELENWLLSKMNITREEIQADAINYVITNKSGGAK